MMVADQDVGRPVQIDLSSQLADRSDGFPPDNGRETSEHLRAVLERAPNGLVSFDRGLRVRFGNRLLATTLGIAAADLVACRTIDDLLVRATALDGASKRRFRAACSQMFDQPGRPSATVDLSDEDGRHPLRADIESIGDGTALASLASTPERATPPKETTGPATTDLLTGMPNRHGFGERLRLALHATGAAASEGEGAAAVVLIDLDRFKPVNDTLGRTVGDALLRLAAKRLRAVVRQSDVVARLDGDEFAVLLSPAPDAAALKELASRFVDMLGRPFLIEGQLVTVSASVGVAQSPTDGADYDRLMRSVNLALEDARSCGRGRFATFRAELDRSALARRSLEIDLRKALALREFELHYQPQIDLESETVVGFEALLRWRHPVRGFVPPGEFIPVAEEIGLIVPLGEWVLRTACREAADWPSFITVAANVSPFQFEEPERLLDAVAGALSGSGLPGRRLELEITESVLLRNEKAVLQALRQLRAMDVRIAMDDFGTGYSSLSQLRSFPFDKIKIDRSFIRDGADGDGKDAIIRAITALGTSLGMSTIAEGVETTDQLTRIRAEGCRSVQGYLFSRPVPRDDVARLIETFSSPTDPSEPTTPRPELSHAIASRSLL